MGINGLTAQYIMLPIRHTAPMTLTLEISADNENSTRTYTTQIPLPDGELKAGNSYLFKAVINGNSVTLASVNVKDWSRCGRDQESPFIRPRIKVRFLFFRINEYWYGKYAYIYPVTSKNNTNMIEIPESATIGKQASETLKGKRIAHVIDRTVLTVSRSIMAIRRNTPIGW